MSFNLGLFLGEMNPNEANDEAITAVLYPPVPSTEESSRLLFLVARDDQHDHSYCRKAFEEFLRYEHSYPY